MLIILNGKGWRDVLQSMPIDKRGIRTSGSDWHSGDRKTEGQRSEKTDVMAKHVDSTATLLGYKSELFHYMTLNDLLSL